MPSFQAPLMALQKIPSQRTLLQVEDNAANAEVVKQLISRRNDLKLLTATNGKQGIEMACASRPNVILMDMRLPDMSGLAAIAILRENPATSPIPVIALSSNAFPEEIKRCLEAGCFRYLTKPYKIADLMAAIDTVLLRAEENRPEIEGRGAMPLTPSGEVGHIHL